MSFTELLRWIWRFGLYVQAALVICGLFICDFTYMQSRNGLFSGTYPLISCNPWSFYMRIRYMRAYFWSPYLSHITRSTCTPKYSLKNNLIQSIIAYLWWTFNFENISSPGKKALKFPYRDASRRLQNTGLDHPAKGKIISHRSKMIQPTQIFTFFFNIGQQ